MSSHTATPIPPTTVSTSTTAQANSLFRAPPQRHKFHGFLFDMDGTLIDSTAAIVKHWHLIGEELGFDPAVVLATSHGRRSIDTLAVLDASKANWEYVHAIEARIPAEYGADAKEIPGARSALAGLTDLGAPWAIVTSGTRPLLEGWLGIMGLPPPPVRVTAEDVAVGKPDPACYMLGRERIGLADGERGEISILVLEDAPSGVAAGKAAGCTVLGLATTHAVEQVVSAGADIVVRDLQTLRLVGAEKDAQGRMLVEVEILDAWIGNQ